MLGKEGLWATVVRSHEVLSAASVPHVVVGGVAVLTLSKLIESKLACGPGNMRRMHRDFADVVELIVVHDLSRSFARHLHKSLRKEFHALVLRARGQD